MRNVLSRFFCAVAVVVMAAVQALGAEPVKLTPKAKFKLAAVGIVADVDRTPDGRILILDAATKRTMLFTEHGSFVRFLDAFPGIPPEETNVNRLVVLSDGGVVIADDEGDRFFFYGPNLERDRVVPFGVNLVNVNGFVRHPSGELWMAGYGVGGETDDKVVHRFSGAGRYLGSAVRAADMPNNDVQRIAMNTGFLAVDPSDATVWFSRLVPFEIVHLSSDGAILGGISLGEPGGCTVPSPEQVGPGLLLLRGDFAGSCQIAVVGDSIVVSYLLEGGRILADVFTRNGAVIQQELSLEDPRTLAKRLPGGRFVRFPNFMKTVEVWEEIP